MKSSALRSASSPCQEVIFVQCKHPYRKYLQTKICSLQFEETLFASLFHSAQLILFSPVALAIGNRGEKQIWNKLSVLKTSLSVAWKIKRLSVLGQNWEKREFFLIFRCLDMWLSREFVTIKGSTKLKWYNDYGPLITLQVCLHTALFPSLQASLSLQWYFI